MKRNFHDELNIFVLVLKEGILSNYVTASRLSYLILFPWAFYLAFSTCVLIHSEFEMANGYL